jgi:CBS domain-containing protein
MLIEQVLQRARERLVTIESGALVGDAVKMMAKPHVDLLVVCSGGVMVGVVTKTDIVAQIARQPLGSGFVATLDTVMARDVTSCSAEDALPEVWRMMQSRGFQRIPILDAGGKPIGVLYARDALQLLLAEVEVDDEMLRNYVTGTGYR